MLKKKVNIFTSAHAINLIHNSKKILISISLACIVYLHPPPPPPPSFLHCFSATIWPLFISIPTSSHLSHTSHHLIPQVPSSSPWKSVHFPHLLSKSLIPPSPHVPLRLICFAPPHLCPRTSSTTSPLCS